MELLVASAVGMMTACWGLSDPAPAQLSGDRRAGAAVLCGQRVHLCLWPSGHRPAADLFAKYAEGYTDPLTQALVLTAIVIFFRDDGGDRDDVVGRVSGNRA